MRLAGIFLILLFGSLTQAAPAPDIAIRDDNKQLWIDVQELAKSEGWQLHFDVTTRRVELSTLGKSLSWFVGVPWVQTPRGAKRINAFPRYDDSVLWVPAQSTLELVQQWLGSDLILDDFGKLSRKSRSSSSTVVLSNESSSSSTIVVNKSSSSVMQTSSATTEVKAPVRAIRTVIIDPGHGGKDPGASGPFGSEKDAVLAVGLKLRQKLQRLGFTVRMTRETDNFIELQDRPAMATKWNGDLFISLHCDAVPGEANRKKANGFKVYILREAQSEEDKAIARRENKAAELSAHKRKTEISPLEWIVLENQLNTYTKGSERFAALLVSEYETGEIRKMGSGAGQAGFMVLVGAFMPAVLIELGFISHPVDGEYLMSPTGQDHIAERIAKSVNRFSQVEP